MKYLITLMMLTACGSQPKTTKENASTDSKEKSSVTNKTRSTYAIVVENKLPVCEEAALDQLVYRRSNDTFYSCDGNEWLEVDINHGTNGRDGKDGKDGKDGANGEDAKPLASNLWLDPVTSLTWLVASPSLTLPNAVAACSSPYRMPTTDEAIAAVSHGILNNNAQSMWINYHETDPNSGMWINPSLTVSGAAIATNPVKGTFCIQE